jgi:hypothetical protein
MHNKYYDNYYIVRRIVFLSLTLLLSNVYHCYKASFIYMYLMLHPRDLNKLCSQFGKVEYLILKPYFLVVMLDPIFPFLLFFCIVSYVHIFLTI